MVFPWRSYRDWKKKGLVFSPNRLPRRLVVLLVLSVMEASASGFNGDLANNFRGPSNKKTSAESNSFKLSRAVQQNNLSLSDELCKRPIQLVEQKKKTCEEYGFFKVTDHGVPMEVISRLEEEGPGFFAKPATEKASRPTSPFGYGSKCIGLQWRFGLSDELCKRPIQLVEQKKKTCEEYGFFKVTDHGVPMEVISRLEEEGPGFFAKPATEKASRPTSPFGYGSKCIGLQWRFG
ncbi:hypothetical protein Ddye_018127, partial [Dipteronia dyeriana]